MASTRWYWCFTHDRVETGDERDDPDNALGPYDSEGAARDWRSTAEDRNERWKEDDEAWSGEDEAADTPEL